jgi:hypothetical protein
MNDMVLSRRDFPRTEAGSRGATRVLMTTAVWGTWHIEQFLTLNLPTLLAPGNLPAFCERRRLRYCIFTTEHDRPGLERAPIVAELRRIMTVEFQPLAPERLGNPIAAHHHAWELATDRAMKDGSFVLFMPPDVAWSDGAFTHLGNLLDEGLGAIFMTYLRVDQDLFIKAMRTRAVAGDFAVAIGSRELVSLALDCLHPLMAASMISSRRLPVHPEMLFWPGPDRALLLRVLAREFFLFDPARFAWNETRLSADVGRPTDVRFISDSDDLFAVSLAEIGKDADWHSRENRADPIDIGQWWLNYDSPINDAVVRHKVRWHSGDADEATWRRIEAYSDRFIRRCAVAREGLRLRGMAQVHSCSRAARLIALATYSGVLARAVRGGAPAKIFLPTNAAFQAAPADILDGLSEPKNWRAWGRLIRAHCQTARRRRVGGTSEPQPTEIVAGPIRVGPHEVYLIDRILVPE